VLGVSKGNAYTMVSRLKDTFESAVAGLVMFRAGRRDCPELNQLLDEHGATRVSPDVRKLIERHTQSCETCQGKRRELVSATALLRALVPLPLMPDIASRIRDGAWAQSQAAGAAAASGGGSSASSSAAGGGHGGGIASMPARVLHALPGPAWLPAVAAVVVAAIAVPAVAFSMRGGSGSDSTTSSSVAAESRGVTPSANAATVSATATTPAIVPASPPVAAGGVSGAASNVATAANADGVYKIALPPGDGVCGFPSIDGAQLVIQGNTATLTSLNGNVASGSATLTGQQLDVQMTGRGGQWAVDLAGAFDSAGNYYGQSKNDGATGQSGFACHFAFTAYTSTPHAADASAACPDAATLFAVWQASSAAAASPGVTGFANVSCWSTWVVASALGNANGQARFSTVPALHVAMDETPAFIAAVCAGDDVPQSWRMRVTCPAAPQANATGTDRDQLRAAILAHNPAVVFDPNCVPTEAGTCMTGEWPAEMLASGIATGPAGGAATFYGRRADGTWVYWFATQNSGGPQTSLPGDMIVCADGDGLNLRAEPSTSAAVVTLIPDGSVVRGDRFVMTDPPTSGGGVGAHPDGWYHIVSPQEGWAYDRFLIEYGHGITSCIQTWWP
jgi:hypothetical protein